MQDTEYKLTLGFHSATGKFRFPHVTLSICFNCPGSDWVLNMKSAMLICIVIISKVYGTSSVQPISMFLKWCLAYLGKETTQLTFNVILCKNWLTRYNGDNDTQTLANTANNERLEYSNFKFCYLWPPVWSEMPNDLNSHYGKYRLPLERSSPDSVEWVYRINFCSLNTCVLCPFSDSFSSRIEGLGVFLISNDKQLRDIINSIKSEVSVVSWVRIARILLNLRSTERAHATSKAKIFSCGAHICTKHRCIHDAVAFA